MNLAKVYKVVNLVNLTCKRVTKTCPDQKIINLEEKYAGNYEQCSSDENGKSYTLELPANGHRRTFKTK